MKGFIKALMLFSFKCSQTWTTNVQNTFWEWTFQIILKNIYFFSWFKLEVPVFRRDFEKATQLFAWVTLLNVLKWPPKLFLFWSVKKKFRRQVKCPECPRFLRGQGRERPEDRWKWGELGRPRWQQPLLRPKLEAGTCSGAHFVLSLQMKFFLLSQNSREV